MGKLLVKLVQLIFECKFLVEKDNFEFRPAVLRLKIDLVSHPARERGIR